MFNPTSLRVAPLLASRIVHLQQVGPSPLGTPMLPGTALGVHTPLSVKAWSLLLADHPNRVWVDSSLKGLERGVRVGFDPNSSFWPAHTNLLSASSHPEVVQRYLDAELACGNVAGPYSPKQLPAGVMFKHFGVIPKPNKPGKWRLIVDVIPSGVQCE